MHTSMQHLSTHKQSLFSVCCLVLAPNPDDITHTLQTFHWSLPINIHPIGEWWHIFQPTFMWQGQSNRLKSIKVAWGLWNIVSMIHDLDAVLHSLQGFDASVASIIYHWLFYIYLDIFNVAIWMGSFTKMHFSKPHFSIQLILVSWSIAGVLSSLQME